MLKVGITTDFSGEPGIEDHAGRRSPFCRMNAHARYCVPSVLFLPGVELLTGVLQWRSCVCEQSLVLGEVLRLALLSQEPANTELGCCQEWLYPFVLPAADEN